MRNAGAPKLAMNAAGDALVAWQLDGINALAYSPASGFGRLKTLSQPEKRAQYESLAMNAGGDAVVSWDHCFEQPDCNCFEDPDRCRTRVEARTYSAAGAYGPRQRLSELNGRRGTPHVAVRADGSALVVWIRKAEDGSLRIEAAEGP